MTHTIQLEPGALDGIPIIVLSDLLGKYGSELATVNGQLIIRKVRRNYKGCTIVPTRLGRLAVLAPHGDMIGEAPTLEDAKRLVDQQFHHDGPSAA